MSRRATCFLLFLLALSGCRKRLPGHASILIPADTPIVLISIDTLRADHLPAYGYRGVETPSIDRLRKDAILFEDAFSHCPLTLPAHLSILTGLLPPEHRVRDNIGYHLDGRALPSLPRFLKARGYATGAAVSAFVLRSSTGLGDFFDFYEDRIEAPEHSEAASQVQRAGGETTSAALAWVKRVRAKPFFLFLHLYEPHSPYTPPEPYASRYRLPYDGEIAAADAIIGDFLGRLKSWGLYDRSLIFLVSDHGEGLGDHGEDEHGILLYREALRVPLLVKLPGSKRGGETVLRPVQLIDIFPTVAGLLGQKRPDQLHGRSLMEAPRSGPPESIYSETYYPRIHLGWSELRSLWDGRHHFIDSSDPELYDLREDSAEKADVFSRNPDVVRAMKRDLNRYPTNFAGPGDVDAEDLKKLAALGYLSVTTPARAGGPLPSPAKNIAILDDIKEAFRVDAAGDRVRSVPLFRKLLEKNPRLFDAQYKLAEILAAQKRFREAAEAYKEAIRISPSASGPVALALARISLAQGELKEAQLNAELAMRESPAEAHGVLARVALARNDLDAVEREVRLAAGASSVGPDDAVLLAEVDLRRNQPREALALLDSTLSRLREKGRPPPVNLQFLRGDALARLRSHAEADRAFQDEIRSFPANSEAYARLAILYAVEHRRVRDVHAVLEAMYAANPGRDSALLAARTLDSIGDSRGAAAWRSREAKER